MKCSQQLLYLTCASRNCMCLYNSVYDVAKMPTDFILAPRSVRLSTGMFSKHARPNLLCFLKYLSARNAANYIQSHITCIPIKSD